MKVIFRFVNNPGFGDNIRGLITILQIQKILKFELEVDFSHHVFSKFFIHKVDLNAQTDYKQYMFCDENIRNDFLMVEIMNEIETKNILTVSTNSYPIIEKIDKNIKTYLKKLFEVKPEINEYLHNAISMLPVDYHLFHYRLGDDVLINNNKVNNDVYLQNFETNKKENAVVISDSLAFKQLFEKCKDVHVFLNTPTHTNQEENIDTLIDFLLITKAKSINCYSVYRWISNFVFWSSIVYDIPLFNIKK